jgi:hypothetical protein
MPQWSDEDGFSAELIGVLTSSDFEAPARLSSMLRVTINEAERAILVHPYVATSGSMSFKSDAPATTDVTLRAQGIIRDLPWDTRASSRVTRLTLASAALDLWYGENTARIEQKSETSEITAHFKAVESCFVSSLGQLKIGLSIKRPRIPAMGDYRFRTQTYATLILAQPLKLAEAVDAAAAIEGLFEILAGFPQRRFAFKVQLNTAPREAPLALEAGPSRKMSKDHPFALFIPRALMPDVAGLLETYLQKHKSLAIMQTTIRYLAGDRIFLPEGFLTACNVIESIGKAAPNSNADLPQLLKTIAKSLKKVDPGLASRFNDEVRIKISTHSSFKDRFDHVKAMLDDLGTPVALEHTALREARGAYRHDVVALKPEHLDAMRAGIGLAWFWAWYGSAKKSASRNRCCRNALAAISFTVPAGRHWRFGEKALQLETEERARFCAAIAALTCNDGVPVREADTHSKALRWSTD